MGRRRRPLRTLSARAPVHGFASLPRSTCFAARAFAVSGVPANPPTSERVAGKLATRLDGGEALYGEIDAEQGRSNLDIEKHLRRAELKLAQANAGLAMAGELGWQGDGNGSPAC